MAKILNQAKAEAVYSAMCALNNVGGNFGMFEIEDNRVGVFGSGAVQIVNKYGQFESYASQSAFATAYGLDHSAKP